jgi:hypothetical protein
MSNTQIAKGFSLTNPGPLDSRRGPYPTTVAACLAIPNTTKLVDGISKNYRDGVFVDIGTDGNYTTFWWKGGYADGNLVEYLGELASKNELNEISEGGGLSERKYGQTLDLSSFTSSTSSNLRMVYVPILKEGNFTKMQYFGVAAGVLKFRMLRLNSDGTYTAYHFFECQILTGINNLTSGIDFTIFSVLKNDFLAFFFTSTGGKIGYKSDVLGVSKSKPGNIDVNLNGIVSDFIDSTSSFGINFTVSGTGLRTIKTDALPEISTSKLNDDFDFGGWKTKSVLQSFLLEGTTNPNIVEPNLISERISGVWAFNADKTAISATGSTNHANTFLVTSDTYVYISGLVDTLNIATIAVFFDSSGKNKGFVPTSALVSVSDGYCFKVPSDLTISECGINIRVVDANVAAKLYLPNGTRTIKKSLLPSTSGSDVGAKSDITSQQLFNRGSAAKAYTAKAYGLLFAGQSNAFGVIPYASRPQTFIDAGNKIPDVSWSNSPGVTFTDYTVAANAAYSFEMYLYKLLIDYLKTKTGNPAYKMYAVKHAVSGTPISESAKDSSWPVWQPVFEKIPSDKVSITKVWEQRLRTILPSVTGQLFEVKCVVWHQGESDKGDENNYYQNLKNLI